MVEVNQLRGDDAAFLRDDIAGQVFGDIQVDEGTGFVVDDRFGGLGIGKRKTHGEESSKPED
jgi:hypothetical protein